MEQNDLTVDFRNLTKSDLLNLSHNFRVLSKINDLNYSSNLIFILSIILAVITGISINLFLDIIKISDNIIFILLSLFIIIIISLIIIIILEMKKYGGRAKFLDSFANKILEDDFKYRNKKSP